MEMGKTVPLRHFTEENVVFNLIMCLMHLERHASQAKGLFVVFLFKGKINLLFLAVAILTCSLNAQNHKRRVTELANVTVLE